MSTTIRVLELRSVRGTGGGPEKTILLGAERADRTQVAVTVCYIRDARDAQFGIGARARQAGVDYVEVVEQRLVRSRASGRSWCVWSATAASTSSTRTTTRPICWRCCWRACTGRFRCPPPTAGPGTARASAGSTTRSTSRCCGRSR